MKKLLLFLALLIPFVSVNAWEMCDGTVYDDGDGLEWPDIPQYYSNQDYVIVDKSNNGTYSSYQLYIFEKGTLSVSFDTSGRIYFTNSGSFQLYSSVPNGWNYLMQLNSPVNFSAYSVMATTVDIYNQFDSSQILYNVDYNIVCTPPTPPQPNIPQDFNIINAIARVVNDLVVDLQTNGITIETIFIGLIIFNLLVFVLCYILAHLE